MLYTLTNGTYTAQVDSLGAQLVSLKGPDGFEVLWTGKPEYWREHAPVLFPIVGALRENRAKIDGQWVEMNRHGFAKRSEFALQSQGEGTLSLRLTPTDATRACYPFDFALTVTYTLTDTGYTTAFTVENTGDKPLPFVVGGHPGFNIPVGEEASFEDYVIRFEQPETQKCPVIQADSCLIDPTQTAYTLDNQREIPLRHELFYNDALVFEGLRSTWVQVVHPVTGKGVEMDFSQFPMLGIWSAKNDGPYVCLEPWTGCATLTTEGDDFAQKKGMQLLPQGEKKDYAFTVKLL